MGGENKAGEYEIRINVGGGQSRTWDGNVWLGDKEYSAGSCGCLDSPTTDAQSTDDQIGGTGIPEIYRSMRVGEKFRYRFDVPNGTYLVNLMFAEIYWETSDAEQPEVLVQGKRVLSKFNIFDLVGHDTAYEKQIDVDVVDGRLEIECRGLSLPMHSGARIAGIEIIATSQTRSPQPRLGNTPETYNVILIYLDTVRRDYLRVYGHPKNLSPSIDRIGKSGVVFDDHVVNCGWTLPQHMSLVTGTWPLVHRQLYLERATRLSDRIPTLAEIFRERGYMTMGFGNRNRYGGGWEYGFERGMRYYNTMFPFNNMMEEATDYVTQALRSTKGSPFFLYLHTNDTRAI